MILIEVISLWQILNNNVKSSLYRIWMKWLSISQYSSPFTGGCQPSLAKAAKAVTSTVRACLNGTWCHSVVKSFIVSLTGGFCDPLTLVRLLSFWQAVKAEPISDWSPVALALALSFSSLVMAGVPQCNDNIWKLLEIRWQYLFPSLNSRKQSVNIMYIFKYIIKT